MAKYRKLSRTASQRKALLRNQVTALLNNGKIVTTEAKAKEVRKAAEKLITRAKVDSVHNRREAAKFIQDEIVLAKLFTNIAPAQYTGARCLFISLQAGFPASSYRGQ